MIETNIKGETIRNCHHFNGFSNAMLYHNNNKLIPPKLKWIHPPACKGAQDTLYCPWSVLLMLACIGPCGPITSTTGDIVDGILEAFTLNVTCNMDIAVTRLLNYTHTIYILTTVKSYMTI